MMLFDKFVYGNFCGFSVIVKYLNKFLIRFKKYVIFDLVFIFISGREEEINV